MLVDVIKHLIEGWWDTDAAEVVRVCDVYGFEDKDRR